MADTSIYRGYLAAPRTKASFDQEAAQADASQLDVLMGRQKLQAVERGNQRATQLQALLGALPAGSSTESQMDALTRGGFLSEAADVGKAATERAKGTAAAGKDNESAAETKQKRERAALEHRIAGLSQFQNPEDAKNWLTDSVVGGHIDMQTATAMVKNIPNDPAAFATWKDNALMGLMSAKDQMTFTKPTAGQRLVADTSAANNKATNARAASEGAANREVTRRGQDLRKGAADAARDAAAKKGSGPGKMSATLQKELIETDEMAETASGTVNTLKAALLLNDKAYSGYGAKQRAQARSNLPKSNIYGGGMDAANATIEMDNLIGTQALQGMKAIFGGNPTEGERAILLDLQASVDKTPAQRKAIIEKGIQLANRRLKINAEKAKSIRQGTYLTDGPGATVDNGADDLAAALAEYGED